MNSYEENNCFYWEQNNISLYMLNVLTAIKHVCCKPHYSKDIFFLLACLERHQDVCFTILQDSEQNACKCPVSGVYGCYVNAVFIRINRVGQLYPPLHLKWTELSQNTDAPKG